MKSLEDIEMDLKKVRNIFSKK